jgi:phage gp46-like protein
MQLYAVITDSPYVYDKRVLARKQPKCCGPRSWWTDRNDSDLWLMGREEAIGVVKDYRYNNARIVKSAKAEAMLDNQSQQRGTPCTMTQLSTRT